MVKNRVLLLSMVNINGKSLFKVPIIGLCKW